MILPKADDELVAVGLLKFTLLNRLKKSARNCTFELARCKRGKFFTRLISVSKYEGPVRLLRPLLPKVPVGGVA